MKYRRPFSLIVRTWFACKIKSINNTNKKFLKKNNTDEYSITIRSRFISRQTKNEKVHNFFSPNSIIFKLLKTFLSFSFFFLKYVWPVIQFTQLNEVQGNKVFLRARNDNFSLLLSILDYVVVTFIVNSAVGRYTAEYTCILMLIMLLVMLLLLIGKSLYWQLWWYNFFFLFYFILQ